MVMMMLRRSIPFHLVDASPWPIMASMSALFVAASLLVWMHMNMFTFFLLGTILLVLVSYVWWRDIVRESTYLSFHMPPAIHSLQISMILFILSEVFFFLSFFWTFFHSSLAAVSEVSGIWPPHMVETLDPKAVPLLNTVVLLSSGVTVTFSHHSLLVNKYGDGFLGLCATLVLGFLFTLLQVMEYFETSFNIADSVYSSVFFMATGFHSFHVIVSSTFLLVCLIRFFKGMLTSEHHVSYECAIWYWHFVDVVWVFLYLCLYWWGS